MFDLKLQEIINIKNDYKVEMLDDIELFIENILNNLQEMKILKENNNFVFSNFKIFILNIKKFENILNDYGFYDLSEYKSNEIMNIISDLDNKDILIIKNILKISYKEITECKKQILYISDILNEIKENKKNK